MQLKNISIILFCLLWNVGLARGDEQNDMQTIAEQFIEQICSKGSGDVFQTFEMTDEFKSVCFKPSTKDDWAKEIDVLFGNLGVIRQREIIDHGGDSQSVFLYYNAAKRPAKIWVTFQRTQIAGLHWNVWVDNTFNEWLIGSTTIVILVYLPLFIVLTIYFGEKRRAEWVQVKKANTIFVVKEWETYQEEQNPTWFYILWWGMTLPVIILLTVVLSVVEMGNALIPTVITMIGLISITVLPPFCFGFFIEVDDRFFTLRFGLVGFRLLHIPIDSIVSVETTTFRPLRDFGGWGMRWYGNGEAYFMSGTEGVVIRTNKNQKYLIGSDIPERLVQVIQAKKQTSAKTK
jgi:hypothetical protein